MLLLLAVITLIAVGCSFCCSMTEAALLSVPLPHVKSLADQGSKRANILLSFKEDLNRPISAILILNTVANTVGAAVLGAIIAREYSETFVLAFSAFFTLLILIFGEIFPKQLGVKYCKTISPNVAIPLSIVIKLLTPLIWISKLISSLLNSNTSDQPSVSQAEVLSMAELGREEGVIDSLEDSVIRNVIELDTLLVKDVLTPRVVVFRLEENRTIESTKNEIINWAHSRIPLHVDENPDTITGYITQRDIFRALISGDKSQILSTLARPITTVPEFMRVDKLLLHMFEMRESICAVVDERGGFAGIVTLEDILEEIVGREIVDEYDYVSDLRSYAQIVSRTKKNKNKT